MTIWDDEASSGGAASSSPDRVTKATGLSLQAGMAAEAHQRDTLLRPGSVPLCPYATRIAVPDKPLALIPIRTVHVDVLSPEFITS